MPSSAGRAALIPGKKGWSDPRTKFTDTGDWRPEFRRWPSVFRIFARQDWVNFPQMPEIDVIKAIRALFNEEAIRKDRRRVRAPDLKERTQELLDYILSPEGKKLESWMRRTSWRAPRLMHGSRDVLSEHLWGIDITMWELAHFRIPRSLVFDDDVIMFHAACQGLTRNDHEIIVRGQNPEWDEQLTPERKMEGMRKLVTDPWFQFALVAPFLTQYGIFFPGCTLFESVARMEVILSNPYRATHREIDFLKTTPIYQAAFEKLRKVRRRKSTSDYQTPIQPMGHWFYAGLGTHRAATLESRCLWAPSLLRPRPRKSPFVTRTFDVEPD